jgi:menaquinone-specific isochorismate synthase
MTVTSDPPTGGGGTSASERSSAPTTSQPPAVTEPGSVPAHLLTVARQLRAVTVEVNESAVPDMVRAGGGTDRLLWRKSDFVLLGVGQALRLPLPGGWADPAHVRLVREVLAAVPAVDEVGRPGSGPVAAGALAYDPSLAGHLSIPRLLVGQRDGASWATLVVPEQSLVGTTARRVIEDELFALRDDAVSSHQPDGFELRASMPHDEWEQLVLRTVAKIEEGHFDKVVLARRVDVVANRPFVVDTILARLASLYPSCAVFHVHGFLGASPETLVARSRHNVLSHPLAGTVARSGDDVTDAALVAGLMASAKDRREHQLVVDAIAGRLAPLCRTLDVPAEPSVLALRNVSHLGTAIRGSLMAADGAAMSSAASLPTSLELAALLQPTPAVGGHPTEAALQWQRDHEGFERGCYAGPVGWVDNRGDGEWALGLRSANVSGRHASLYAGNGIVAGSGPEAELAETQLKLQALLAALVRP